MDFKQFAQLLRRRWLTIFVFTVVAVGVSAGLSAQATPQYESEARVFVSVDLQQASDGVAVSLFTESRIGSYASLATSGNLMRQVADDLGIDVTTRELAEHITAEVVPETTIIRIVARDDQAEGAQRLASITAQRLTQYLTDLETPSGSDTQLVATVTDEAGLRNTPVSPRTRLNLIVALLIGLMIGTATALARELLDRTVTTMEHVRDVSEAPVLASIGVDKQIKKSPLLTDLDSFAQRTEAFRLLRTNLRFLDLDEDPRCLVISSAVPSEGKTMTSTNLALALAQAGRNTLLIDGDLRRPRVARQLDLDGAVGLTTVLVGSAEIEDAVQVHEASGLHVLTSGPKPPNPTEILQSRVTHETIKELIGRYDMVIIDAPPLLPVADASVLSTLADGVILVVRHGKTTRDQLEQAVGRLEQVGGRLFGVVINLVPKRASRGYYYYYYEDGNASRAK
ncbi:polysaccharide biosynthesis tyrosine autokinase [Nocardioides salsibiostraticola]